MCKIFFSGPLIANRRQAVFCCPAVVFCVFFSSFLGNRPGGNIKGKAAPLPRP